MIINVILFLLIVVLTVAVVLWFAIAESADTKAGKKSFLWERKSDTRPNRDTQAKD